MTAHDLPNGALLLLWLFQGGGIWAYKFDRMGHLDVSGLSEDLDGDFAGAHVEFMRHQNDGGPGDFSVFGQLDRLAGSAQFVAFRGIGQLDLKSRALIALVGETKLVVVTNGRAVDVKWRSHHTGRSDIVGLGLVHRGHGEGSQAEAAQKGIKKDTGAKKASLFARQPVQGIVAHESGGPVDFLHDVVACVDAGGTTNALELESVPDIDTCRADIHTAPAIDAIGCFGIVGLSAWLSAVFVVSDDDGVVVRHRGLQSSVGTNHDAELLAEMGKAEVKRPGEEHDRSEGGEVIHGILLNVSIETLKGDKVGKKDVGQQGGHDDVEAVFENAAPNLGKTPGGFIKLLSSGGVAIDDPFDPPEDVLQENGVRTGPPTPKPTE